MSVHANPRAVHKCGNCGARKSKRHLTLATLKSVSVATAAIAYQNRFPYVSNSLPFGGKGARHVGPNKKLLVESKRHEERLRHIHGYTGEAGIGQKHSTETE